MFPGRSLRPRPGLPRSRSSPLESSPGCEPVLSPAPAHHFRVAPTEPSPEPHASSLLANPYRTRARRRIVASGPKLVGAFRAFVPTGHKGLTSRPWPSVQPHLIGETRCSRAPTDNLPARVWRSPSIPASLSYGGDTSPLRDTVAATTPICGVGEPAMTSSSRTFPLTLPALLLVALSCGGSRPAPEQSSRQPGSTETTEVPPPPGADEETSVPEDCEARTNSLSGKCFKSAFEACKALQCAAPRVCTYGYSMPVVVSCGDPS